MVWMDGPKPKSHTHHLKPCPCCGGEAVMWSQGEGPWIACTDCNLRLDARTEHATVQQWNRRFETAEALQAENERLREALKKVCEIAHDLQTREIAEHVWSYKSQYHIDRFAKERAQMQRDLETIIAAEELSK